jgi:hypothetical protein
MMAEPSKSRNWIACAALVFVATTFGRGEAAAQTNIEEFDFQLAQETVRQGDDVIIEVRLLHTPTGKPVPDAVIFARRMDMEPDGMPTMTADLILEPSDQPGIYRFRTSLAMEGAWRLSLAAKVQGATGTLQKRLVLKAQN